jgi:hypothetical protein
MRLSIDRLRTVSFLVLFTMSPIVAWAGPTPVVAPDQVDQSLALTATTANSSGPRGALAVIDELTASNAIDGPARLPLTLSPANLSLLSRLDALAPIYPFPTPRDALAPVVTLTAPIGGEVLPAEAATTISWTATDADGIAFVDVFVSLDGGATYDPVALGLSGSTTSLTWHPANRPTTSARIRVEATDSTLNLGSDESEGTFTITAVAGGSVPTTLRDFDQPGTQPFEHGVDLRGPNNCSACHGNYDVNAEPDFVWKGSMMANSSRDPLFEACLTIANQDAPSSGDLCLRCHIPAAWTAGRSNPTDGSQVLTSDLHGVSCDVCHRMVDPIPDVENPIEDIAILAALSNPPSEFGTGMMVLDPDGTRRGPFSDVQPLHAVLVSPFHQESAFCGTCHDVSNPAFEKDGSGNYVPNALDAPATDFSPHTLMPIERTYSEWLNSAYNSPQGIYAPQFGGNKDYVSTCQDCHMRDVTGAGCAFVGPRTNMPLHDFTGGSAWMVGVLATLFPGDLDPAAQAAAAARSRAILQNAATLTAEMDGSSLKVRVTNETGHKLPTGYPEGRRMWLNVRFLDESEAIIAESGAYISSSGVLVHDSEIKVYETELGLDAALAASTGLPEAKSFHFVLNNKVYKDNRIPPRGFTNAAYAQFGGSPVGASYADGQYWDDTHYTVPACAVSAEVTLYYQSTSKEYVEFLRDENVTDSKGQAMYDIWANNGKCPPETMAIVTVQMPDCNANNTPDACEAGVLVGGDFDGDGDLDLADHAAFTSCLGGPSQPASPGDGACQATCERVFDSDLDGDVDLRDHQALQNALAN